ncbi:hypothetical protein NKI54_23250 [Mesorhizobium sp. M0663]|uniref:hypothetical protein n=1 Tax=unclassified Mesorhizobium TaxID=325217 RepID=UPI0033374B40
MRSAFPVLIACSILAAAPCAAAEVEFGGDATASLLALTNPDEYAWQVFFSVSRPAELGTAGVADSSKKFGDAPDLPLVWETWALESGGDHSEVYKTDGSRPPAWEKLPRESHEIVLDENLERKMVLSSSKIVKPKFDPLSPVSQEVRANRIMYEKIVSGDLYSRNGLERNFAAAVKEDSRKKISFDQGAKEIKAEWRPIRDEDKPRYLWRKFELNGQQIAIGLVALHIITKDLPNWVWIDFGHRDCEIAQGACDNKWLSQFGFPTQLVAETSPVDATIGQDGVRAETRGTVWQNYILRGAQTEFTTSIGSPTVLSNPVIENTFQKSSCISCHARASVGPRLVSGDGKQSDDLNTLSSGDPELGTPNETLFGAGPGPGISTIEYIQTDFIWSAPFRSMREQN